MDKFNEDAICVKCGYGLADSKFSESTVGCLPDDPDTYLHKPAMPERIRRECRRCGHIWYEEPLDAG